MDVMPTDAPLTFVAPPGWPTPTAAWVREHQGLPVPSGWAPVPGLAPAPAGWVFWKRNAPVWDAYVRPTVGPVQRRLGWGIAVFVLGVILIMSGLVIFWGAIVLGSLLMIEAGIAWVRAEDAAMASIRRTALRRKQEADVAAYERYLGEIARQNR
ncbi:hypothetical protein [Leifsonia poae]|uniref:hypothetical protein n=1 Tax=Leifsonia poae TaxID=110933 RepID=UPI003D673295